MRRRRKSLQGCDRLNIYLIRIQHLPYLHPHLKAALESRGCTGEIRPCLSKTSVWAVHTKHSVEAQRGPRAPKSNPLPVPLYNEMFSRIHRPWGSAHTQLDNPLKMYKGAFASAQTQNISPARTQAACSILSIHLKQLVYRAQ